MAHNRLYVYFLSCVTRVDDIKCPSGLCQFTVQHTRHRRWRPGIEGQHLRPSAEDFPKLWMYFLRPVEFSSFSKLGANRVMVTVMVRICKILGSGKSYDCDYRVKVMLRLGL